MNALAGAIAAAFEAACRDELDAPKPGNVHRFASGHRMTVAQFVASAAAAARPLAAPGTRVGTRILAAIEATNEAAGANTNLGIVLLCAPLAAAAERAEPDLRTSLARVLSNLDVEDAQLAFRAIVRAAPAGLGRAERHDVFEPARVTLRDAMIEAAHRDRVAAQYASEFADVFELGVPQLDAVLARTHDRSWAILAVYLGFLSAFPDSHVVRKYGPAPAEDVRRRACDFRLRLDAGEPPDDLLPELLHWDADLKRREINPGTSADLTVATAFAHRLRNILPSARNSD